MNKNIKKTIALALALGTFSVAGPAKYMNLFVTEAHASTSSADELTSLDLETSSGTNLNLYTDSSYDDELDSDLSVGDTYYAKTSASKVTINSIDGADDDNVRIFKGSSSTAYGVGDDISISSGTTTTLKVRVYEDAYDSSEDYSSSDYNQYTIVVKNSDSDSTTSSDADLLGIALSNGSINFNPSTASYDVNVPTNADSTIIQANPKESGDTVTINGSTVSSSEEYKKTITLSSTTTTVTIKVSNDDADSKTYTLNIKKTLNATQGQQGQQGQGQQGQGQAQQGQGQQGQGVNNGNQAGNNGQKGWQQTNNTWYYFDNNGQKKTGWMQDTTGKWYYLNSDGSMAHDTTVGGYQVGSDGAWVQ